MNSFILDYVDTALLTILIETPIFFCCGYKKLTQLISFILINYVSNTLLNDALPAYTPELLYWAKLILGELLVIALEYAVMLHIVNDDKKKLLRTIGITNLTSVIVGLMIFF